MLFNARPGRLARIRLALFAAALILAAGAGPAAASPGGASIQQPSTGPSSSTTSRGQTGKSAGIPVQVILTTNDGSAELTQEPEASFGHQPVGHRPLITVNPSVRYQKIRGFGAAMTDTAAWLLYAQLGTSARTQVFQKLFSSSGIHLDYMRIPMAASDFTATGVPYSYDDVPSGKTDPGLAHFSLSHDLKYVLPALRMMLSINHHIFTLANPWSAPPWMKSNDAFNNTGFSGAVLPRYYPQLAQYFVRFLAGYQKAGVPINAITLMNEPRAQSPYPGTFLVPTAAEPFLLQNLAPALAQANLHPLIYAGDDANVQDIQAMLSGPAAPDLAGFAFHCYGGMGQYSALHYQFPHANVLENECSPGINPMPVADVAIDATRNWASGAQLWNLALDPSGGPVEPPDSGCPNCSGVVTVNEHTHQVSYGLHYYQYGQITRYVQPGAVRIQSTRLVHDFAGSHGRGVTPGIDDVAFVNPNGTRVLVAYNNSGQARFFSLRYQGKVLRYQLPALSIVTFVWR